MKNKYCFAAIFLLSAFLLFAGCTGTCVQMLYDDDNGKTVTVNKDCEVRVQLTENPTTGYMWELSAPGLTLISDKYNPDEVPEGMVGSGGVHEWVYKAENTGIFTITGIYKRSWEETSTDDTTWEATVTVK